jgi:hypothetical protein
MAPVTNSNESKTARNCGDGKINDKKEGEGGLAVVEERSAGDLGGIYENAERDGSGGGDEF